MRTILSIALIWGLFVSGFAQVADNVQEATRYRVNQDNITISNNAHPSYTADLTQSELKFLENRSQEIAAFDPRSICSKYCP